MKVKLTLKTITPLHIGNGDRITPMEFIYDRSKREIHVYDFDSIVENLKNTAFLPIFSGKLKAAIKANKFFTLKETVFQDNLLRKAFEKIQPIYSIPVEVEQFWESANIEAFVKVLGKAYIPGSELKGSLRRALLMYVLENDDKLYSKLVRGIKNVLRHGDNKRKQIGKVVSQVESEVFRGGEKNAQKDVMKFVQFSDSECFNPSSMLKVQEIRVFYTDGRFKKFRIFSEVIDSGKKVGGIMFSVNKKLLEEGYYNCHQLVKDVLIKGPEKVLEIWEKAEKKNLQIDKELLNLISERKRSQILNTKGLIRIGKHEGYLFTTVMALVKERNEDLFEEVFKTFAPRFRGTANKTRKLTVKERLPLGFCAVEIV
jgi:CRISPR type III-A-associated RAMP protein Csm5